MNFAIAVKALIIKDNEVLLIKRRSNDVHSPGRWDIPGGRLNSGEDPIQGLARECVEEIGMEIQPISPIGIDHFMRDDGQLITMIILLCQAKDPKVTLSEEHVEFSWVKLGYHFLPVWLHKCLDNIKNINRLELNVVD